MNANTSVALVPIDRCFADGEGLAFAGFLAGYRGSTRQAYALDLRQFSRQTRGKFDCGYSGPIGTVGPVGALGVAAPETVASEPNE